MSAEALEAGVIVYAGVLREAAFVSHVIADVEEGVVR